MGCVHRIGVCFYVHLTLSLMYIHCVHVFLDSLCFRYNSSIHERQIAQTFAYPLPRLKSTALARHNFLTKKKGDGKNISEQCVVTSNDASKRNIGWSWTQGYRHPQQ